MAAIRAAPRREACQPYTTVRFASAPYPTHGVPRLPEWRERQARIDGTRMRADPPPDAVDRMTGSEALHQDAERAVPRLRHRGVRNESDRTCRRECRAGATRSCVASLPYGSNEVDRGDAPDVITSSLGGDFPPCHDTAPDCLEQFVEPFAG